MTDRGGNLKQLGTQVKKGNKGILKSIRVGWWEQGPITLLGETADGPLSKA